MKQIKNKIKIQNKVFCWYRDAVAKRRESTGEEGIEREKEGLGFYFLAKWKAKQCRFWLKFDIVTHCNVFFNPSNFDCWLALQNNHLSIPPFDKIFPIFFLDLSIIEMMFVILVFQE